MVQQKEMNFEGLRTEYGRRGVFDDRRFEGRHSLQHQDGLTTKLHKLHIKFVFFLRFLKSIP